MTNPNISLSVQGLDTATPINQATDQSFRNEMSTQQILRQHYDNLDAREKSRLSSTIAGAVQLKSFIDNNDLEGAYSFLTRRKQSLQSRMGAGENVDTQETDAALEMLRSGRIDELKNGIGGLMAAGQVYGILNSQDSPSNVREWQYYNSLSPEQRTEYLTMKRANPVVDTGDAKVFPNPTNPAAPPLTSFPVNPKPEDMPDFKREQARATAEGTATANLDADAKGKITQTAVAMSSFEELKKSSKNAPSGVFEDIGATLSNKSGYGGKSAVTQADFASKRGAAENAARALFRVVGSGADTERDAKPIIEMLPEEGDSAPAKEAKINAAMQELRNRVGILAKQRGLPNPFDTEGMVPAAGGDWVRGFDPQSGRFMEVSKEDLQAAIAEGFQPQ
jgi:hypothetical protein